MKDILSDDDWKTVEYLVNDPKFNEMVNAEKRDGVTSVFLMILKLSQALLKARTRIEALEDASSSAITTLEKTLNKSSNF